MRRGGAAVGDRGEGGGEETIGPGFQAASFGMIICLCNYKHYAIFLFFYF